ncbi:hypothetical protein Syun_010381 [Stephania yunnanensis]|uniref:Receptor-like serine/threonine-protein kinase n=1 Tax=Stephania yunnanensis TaxID=152371 RepID=A0AAP0KIP9_9MAGN
MATIINSSTKHRSWEPFISLLILCSHMFILINHATSLDTITPTMPINDGQTIISTNSNFELGFFSPINSPNRYLGIWYKKISPGTLVWVANRDRPIPNKNNATLKINSDGNLVIVANKKQSFFWASKNSSKSVNTDQNLIAQLLDSGNFVLRFSNNDDPDEYLWQSFDYPTDTLLPGMKIGWDSKTGLNRALCSWRAIDDPSMGNYSYAVDIHGVPQMGIWKAGQFCYRAGSWNGLRFTGSPQLNENPVFEYTFVYNQNEAYYTTWARNNSVVTRFVLNNSGIARRLTWNDRNKDWVVYSSSPRDQCDSFGLCGAHGICSTDSSPMCRCLEGFVPKAVSDWNAMDWSNGCVRRSKMGCGEGEGFRLYPSVKLPDTRSSWVSLTMGMKECEEMCLKNCSCSGYASANARDGSGCLLWFGDLIDMRRLVDNGQDLFIKMPASELVRYSHSKKRLILIVVGVLVLSATVFLCLVLYICKKRRQKKEEKKGETPRSGRTYAIEEDSKEELELPLFGFDVISNATDNFSEANKVGEGGFGPVFKGKLGEGKEIAVKRLSRNTAQKLSEFKSEAELIAKLQHRNLVKLLGYCIERDERMLVYEFMSNKSLDFFIFDSRLRIVHRDLKASNVLLDDEMKPKISDFGLARCFGGDEIEANTTTVIGTYGYMSPEYTTDGLFSIKSDVFSFGVLVLEIITGKKNRGFYYQDCHLNLLGHVWRLWTGGSPLELIDESIALNSSSQSEVLRCMHVGLLCVQHSAEDRPSMSSVVVMLSNETTNFPSPQHPGFFTERVMYETESSGNQEYCTAIDMTMTLLESR